MIKIEVVLRDQILINSSQLDWFMAEE